MNSKKNSLRKNIIISDDNYDDEHDKICEELGMSYGTDMDFFEILPGGFEKQPPNEFGEEVYCRITSKPNFAHCNLSFGSALTIEETAFEYANGYMVVITFIDDICFG